MKQLHHLSSGSTDNNNNNKKSLHLVQFCDQFQQSLIQICLLMLCISTVLFLFFFF